MLLYRELDRLESSKKRLECEHGLVLNNPAYTTYHVEIGTTGAELQ